MRVKGNSKIHFDFHVHTIPGSPDASQSVTEMIQTAVEAGINTVAITDHNSIDSLLSIHPEEIPTGFTIINGVELSSTITFPGESNGKVIHVLGLGIRKDKALFDGLNSNVSQRYKVWFAEIVTMLEKLYSLHLEAKDMKSLREELVRKNAFASVKDAKTFIDNYKGDDVNPLVKIPVSEVVSLIHQLGGIAVWAHPNRGENHKVFGVAEIEEIASYLVKRELDGIELYHPDVLGDNEAFECVRQIAEKYSLLKSIGSDRHKCDMAYGEYYFIAHEKLERADENFDLLYDKIMSRIEINNIF